jgi:hypothetical protein
MKPNPAQIAAWLKLGEAVIGSSLVQRLLPQIGETLKLTDAEKAGIAANIADYDARIARAEAAAGNNDRDADGA